MFTVILPICREVELAHAHHFICKMELAMKEVQMEDFAASKNSSTHSNSQLPSILRPISSPHPHLTNLTDEEIYHELHATQRQILTPAEVYIKARHVGESKAEMAWYKIFLLSVIGGSFVSLGAATTFFVAGNMKEASWNPDVDERNYGMYRLVLGAFGYQMGFTALTVLGADLFTSYCTYTSIAWLEGRLSLLNLSKILLLNWLGNFVGCLFVAWLFYETEMFIDHDQQLILSTEVKLQLPWRKTLVRGIFANYLVGIATLMQIAALDMTGKVLAIFLPIFTFAAIGFEHSIASQFILPMGCLQGADYCTVYNIFVVNLLPSTLGNWIGGVMIAVPYSICFGHPLRTMRSRLQSSSDYFQLNTDIKVGENRAVNNHPSSS
jgi:formate transporter